MSMIRNLIKSGLAMQVVNQARKPENQQRAKDLFKKMSSSKQKRR